MAGLLLTGTAQAQPTDWLWEWTETDFDTTSISFDEILSGEPPKDGIPSIDGPVFESVAGAELPDNEPMLTVEVDGLARAYPLRILMCARSSMTKSPGCR